MKLKYKDLRLYSFALIAPLVATVIANFVQTIMPKGNISLVYLTAVLLVAVQTHTKPALLCAITSFLAYNFFFTAPEFSLVMFHEEDILTVSFFLLMAAVTGQLTARLREKLNALKDRELVNKLQFTFSEKLTRSINSEEVIKMLYEFLLEATCDDVIVVHMENENITFKHGTADLIAADRLAMKQAVEINRPTGKYTEQASHSNFYFYPLSVDKQQTLVLGMQFKKDAISITDKINLSGLLIQQTVLALVRIQLTTELECERIEKEQELLRSALLSSVSHDLKTPLSAMIGATTSLIDLDESLNTEQKKELLESILDESQRLDRYIQNLLDMTRLGHGELTLRRDWVSFDDILNVVIKRINNLHHEHHFNIQLGKDLPLLWVHAALIEQALFNILDNAIKFSPNNSDIDIKVNLSTDKKGISILIKDQGPGIPDEEQDKIFDMFHTIRHGDRHPSGTGLGLTICKGIISAHGGEIAVLDDKVNAGTTFHIYLPVTGTLNSNETN
jgi:two-component system sensor histidine kinase KdpD